MLSATEFTTTKRKPFMFAVRRQASLFLRNVPALERLRTRFNPEQAKLIPAHVTLCREDEVQDWTALEDRIRCLQPIAITLGFGTAIRDGNFVYLPAVAGVEQFDELRRQLLCERLGDATTEPRKQMPHVTVVHPRNGVCSDAIYHEISQLPPFTVQLRQISLIEQTHPLHPWAVLSTIGPM